MSRGEVLQNGTVMDCLIKDLATRLPRAAIEYKRPVLSADRRTLRELDVLAHLDQVLGYATQLAFRYPQVAFLPLILTNGWSFLAGYGQRTSLGNLSFYVCTAPFSLYDWETEAMGPDFGLFWQLCTYKPLPPLPLDLQLPSAPGITVRVERCIGHGASSFVYQGSLVTSSVMKKSRDRTYLNLEAGRMLAIKVLKERESEEAKCVWDSEMRAIRWFIKTGTQDCCVFPICWDNGTSTIIYPLGTPVVPTVSVKPAQGIRLGAKHFKDLLQDLRAMHRAGIVHRDVRLPNILIANGKAKLTDFGFSTPPTTSHCIVGTMETASQAILAAALKDGLISYEPRDDLESLLKVFLMHHNGFKIDPVEGYSWTRVLYRAWKPNIKMCGITGMNYTELWGYLEQLFDSREEAWEQHRSRRSPAAAHTRPE